MQELKDVLGETGCTSCQNLNFLFRSKSDPRRQQLLFSPYAGTSNRNRNGENNSASRDQEFQERAKPENNHDENQAVGLQVISVFFFKC